jgi:LacI family transcriptional regulator
MTSQPTLQAIANLAGVTRNTVSAVLRDRPGYAEATRNRIKALAAEHGYQANPMVSALMRSVRRAQPAAHRGNQAYLHPFGEARHWDEKSFLRELFEGARSRGLLMGFHVDPVWMNAPGMTGKKLTRMLVARGVEGVIVSSLLRGRGRFHLDWEKFAAVTLGFSLWRPALHRVATNQYHVMGIAMRNLRRLGYSRVGAILSHELDARFDFAWEGGVVIVNNSLPKRQRIPPLITEDLKPRDLGAWLKKNRVDAIIDGGAGVEKHLASLGLVAPRDLGLVSLSADGSPEGPATVRPDWSALGAAALDVVAEQLIRNERGIPAKPRTVLLEGDWVAGATVRKRVE